ncbi:unnamed protein product [Bursaphelenchus xylophilus]|uniref:(pine wood nematode) hypothetical protein n=1 Tax=Bursaphelenchus xylophilus TaxID=6326 RepID=A0A1I7RWC1_BURXY|nr:unnamed protein product [Bursaphelenchus xylophilus]CAG9095438.1 unnamed protein product [Bursaphelenchus xylophilus]
MKLLIPLCCTLLVAAVSAGVQSIAVQGILTCDGKPAAGVKVKLYDVNRVSTDNKLAEGKTDARGYFNLQGSEKSVFTLKPKFNVYHKCHYFNPIPTCYQKFAVNIPSRYITEGAIPQKTFDAGRFNLEAKYPGQERDCVN